MYTEEPYEWNSSSTELWGGRRVTGAFTRNLTPEAGAFLAFAIPEQNFAFAGFSLAPGAGDRVVIGKLLKGELMETKRSKAITIFGILVIIIGLLRLIAFLLLFTTPLLLLSPNELTWQNVSNFISLITQEIQKQIGISVFQLSVSQFLNLGFFISGIGILFLKSWARRLLLGLSIIGVFLIISGALFQGIRIVTNNIDITAFYIASVYFFTRPNVKEQFK